MGRIVTMVLVDDTGVLLGALPPLEVEVPWWQEIGDVVAAVRARDGLDVQVLRVLDGVGELRPAAGGRVTYLAQTGGNPGVGLEPADVDLSPQPLRAAYAKPGGPAASIGWAVSALAALGVPGATATQHRTWNLSAIWRLDAGGAPVAWIKQVPAFFGHEPAALGLVAGAAPGLVPPLLAAGDEGRMLLAHVPGADGYGAGADVCTRIAQLFHPVQVHFADRIADLFAAGVPDARLRAEPFARVAEPYLDDIDGLRELIADLPRRLDAVAACGLPDTLVHGDLHPGNARLDGAGVVLMDWGDCTVGHPAHDILRVTGELADAEARTLVAEWASWWRAAVPGSDPERAVELMRPVAALRSAQVYADFLAAIEPAEHTYHAADVPERLSAAVAAALP
ncbi:phosphotransferase family protein [Jidongwangia harbinensis]|uniref:phosphotransferase family protein n=1 Tax=Jidongwangia harbinensis TaxID=2878561 RepID=UPI001CD96C9E|nr:phosphotransferase [Jidongwangia harbinensis]MCA2214785.1 phosphotransferase [Jidongwangia harbinensis]